jgi:hypothetical protein
MKMHSHQGGGVSSGEELHHLDERCCLASMRPVRLALSRRSRAEGGAQGKRRFSCGKDNEEQGREQATTRANTGVLRCAQDDEICGGDVQDDEICGGDVQDDEICGGDAQDDEICGSLRRPGYCNRKTEATARSVGVGLGGFGRGPGGVGGGARGWGWIGGWFGWAGGG